MAPKSREVEGGFVTLWLITVVCRLEVTFVTAVQKTACWDDSELMLSERKLLLNCGPVFSRTSVVWVVGGKRGGGGGSRG